ncbi:hypothetical protein HPHPA11_0143 [Helicobacter pylori Hp A-11]|uniref:Uncharacterized protein n=1 Tax=Helicobacter pylori Hp A-11 TaxID=992035 RepID=N4TIF9_HELPX|nr:hypothetical protein HPHPA11_0143 [Helicobacter pylori Hp A-11]
MFNKRVIEFLKAKFERNSSGFSMSIEIFKIAKNTQLRKICIKFYWNGRKKWVGLN